MPNIVMMLLDADLEVRDTALDVILTFLEDGEYCRVVHSSNEDIDIRRSRS